MRLFVLLLCVLLPSLTFAESKPTTFNLATESWAGYTNADGSGYYFDLYRMLYKPEGIELKIEIASYERSVKLVEAQRTDGWIGAYWEEEDFALFPDKDKHIGYDQVAVLTLKGKGLENKNALTGKSLGWIKGYGYDEYLETEVEIHEVNDRETGLKLVQAGRLDGFMDNRSDIEEAIATSGYKSDEFEIQDTFKLYLYPAFVKSVKGEQLRNIWNRRYEELKNDPKFTALLEEL